MAFDFFFFLYTIHQGLWDHMTFTLFTLIKLSDRDLGLLFCYFPCSLLTAVCLSFTVMLGILCCNSGSESL